MEGKERTILHPIMYVSGLFEAASSIEALLLKRHTLSICPSRNYHSILMILILLSEETTCLLKDFLEKNTLNSKFNNWSGEIEQYQIKFEYIKGIKNTLADTISKLISIDPDTCQD